MPSATIVRSGSHGEEEFHSVAGSPLLPPDEHHDDSEAVAFDAPIHPVKTLQGSFEESIVESADDHDGSDSVNGSAESRRQTLLEAKKYDESWQTRWKQRATARYHPLLKLIAQIVFGMHLLQQQQAKSEGEVVKILQAHVNEVDTFLEKTAEDFDLANNDIQERIRHLKLPMEHRDVFEVMLDDKKFRSQLLDGNDKIESIIDRTTKAMDASMYDLNEGIKANGELGKYLDGVSGRWPKDKRVIAEVFGAMRGNEQGWTRYIADLQLKAKTLKQNLAQLTTLLGEMSRMAAVASRRNISQRTRTTSSVGSKSAPTSPGLRSKFPEDEAPPVPSSPPRSVRSTKSSKSLKDVNKPLPRDPSAGASKSTSRNHAVPMADRFDRSRQMPLSQDTSRTPLRPSVQAERPRTAGGISSKKAREADHRENTADLAAFLKQAGGAPQRSAAPQHHNPLRSNPPDEEWADLERSQSHPNGQAAGQSARSRSQGGIDIMKGAEQARSQMGLKSRDSTSTSRTSSDQGVDKKGNLVGTGFARRLSKRMKHLPTAEEEAALVAAEKQKAENPSYPDSAYASGPDSQSASSAPHDKDKKSRPDSFVAPLPSKSMEPLYASRVTTAQAHAKNPSVSQTTVNSKVSNNRDFLAEEFAGAQSVRSLAPTNKSKGSAIKSVFQRKWSSGRKMFQQKEIWNSAQ